MNPDPDPWPRITTLTDSYNNARGWTAVHDPAGPDQERSAKPEEPWPQPRPLLLDWEHDREKAIVRIRWPDGKVEVFRAPPIRHLVVQPDPVTGAIKPVVKGGSPMYLRLCREEREAR